MNRKIVFGMIAAAGILLLCCSDTSSKLDECCTVHCKAEYEHSEQRVPKGVWMGDDAVLGISRCHCFVSVHGKQLDGYGPIFVPTCPRDWISDPDGGLK